MGTLALQQRISSSIEQHREEYIAISQDIHAHP